MSSGGGGGGGSAWINPTATGPRATPTKVINGQASLTTHGLPGSWSNGVWNLAAGVDLSGYRIDGGIYWAGAGTLKLTDCEINQNTGAGAMIQSVDGSGPLMISYCRFKRTGTNNSPGQGAIQFWNNSNSVVEYCDISGNADGIQLSGTNNRIEYNWIHDLYVAGPSDGSGTHNDGIQCYSGNHTIRGNNIAMPMMSGNTNAALFFKDGAVGNVLVDGNYLEGFGFQMSIWVGNFTIRNNRFVNAPGSFGAILKQGGTIVAQSGNTNSSGQPITL